MMNKLFVYGSMKKGFKNHWRLENETFLGSGKTDNNYNMYPAESFSYPYGVEYEEKWQLFGELYELKNVAIEEIDIFEGAPEYYYRKEVGILLSNSSGSPVTGKIFIIGDPDAQEITWLELKQML